MSGPAGTAAAIRFGQFSLRCLRFWPVVLAALLFPALAAFRPSFGLDYCSWNATHIILAVMTTQDDDFEVIESWKGSLKVGDHIVVSQLEPSPNAIPIGLYSKQSRPYEPSGNGAIEDIPRRTVGSRVILFLRRESEDERAPNTSTTGKSEWQPADFFHEIRTSVIWIDESQLYVFTQWVNLGPSLLSTWDKSLANVHNRVREVIQIQNALTEAVRVKDKSERAELLKPYVRSDAFPAKEFALQELGKCGPSALESIRKMLDDSEYTLESEDLIKAYSQAGGEMVGEELNGRLQKEIAFWQETGPSLQQGWWNQNAKPDAPLRLRYGQTIQLIRGLQHTQYLPALATAVQLRDFWKSLPQLNDPSGLDGLAKECDSLVNHLKQVK
jgi:hypothetical protein